ncbi:SRPBCC domain-containing protein [Amycolatopsis sp. NPDC059657]|uniref:SRPBCC family protein n=1 Tax=Amycolatopsis sp. NPDC059657 TaxID=3346899 RepID=UPI003672E434
MGHQFETENEAVVGATPEQVWDAIATGPGIDSWFMGRNEVENGVVRTAFGQYNPEMAVTAAEPGRRFAYESPKSEDGRFIAYEFLIEGRDGGSTVLRAVTSGFLPGDDWADEFEAMSLGGALFFATLETYLNHFAGRTARPLTAFGPPVSDWDHAWTVLHRELGLSAPIHVGDRAVVDGIEGTVYFVNPHTLGIRTEGALYRFLRGFHGAMVAGHHFFDGEPDQQAWDDRLTRLYA